MASVIYKLGTREQYDRVLPKDENTLYWLVDEQRIYKGETLYAAGKEATGEMAGLMSAADKKLFDEVVKSGAAALEAADASVKIESGDAGKTIKVAISAEPENGLSLKEDGLFAEKGAEYEIEKKPDGAEEYAAVYRLKKTAADGSESYVGEEINIPKDLVIKSGTVETVAEDDQPYKGAKTGDKYLDIVLSNEKADHIYVPVNDLVDQYKAGNGIAIEDSTVSVKVDESTANGLTATAAGLGLAAVTKTTPGAMTSEDKKALDAVPHVYMAAKYDVLSVLDGTRVDIMDKEIRVMFKEDADWHKQEGPTGGNRDENSYYFAVRLFAPAALNDVITGFKEDGGEEVKDPVLYHFVAKDFGGVDEFGRKYSIIWLPAAHYNTDEGTWKYFGDDSTTEHMMGWTHTIEWYNESEECVASNTVRINLTNKDCHNMIEPYYMAKHTGSIEWQDM